MRTAFNVIPTSCKASSILESDKATTKGAGGGGVWHESWLMGRIDSILVTNASGFDVDVKDKLTTLWGEIKIAY